MTLMTISKFRSFELFFFSVLLNGLSIRVAYASVVHSFPERFVNYNVTDYENESDVLKNRQRTQHHISNR